MKISFFTSLVLIGLLFGTVFLTAEQAGAKAQSYSAKVVDQETGQAIPFATVQYGQNQGVITNEEGIFLIPADKVAKVKDSVQLSSIGYENKGIWLANYTEAVIELAPKTFELKGVFLTSNPLDAEQIIDSVKAKLTKNYRDQSLSKKQIFFRESSLSAMKKVDFNFKKSTIAEFDKAFIDSIAHLVPRSSAHYQEVAGDFYGNYNKHKLVIDKAAELYDKTKDVSVDGLGDKIERVFKENVKPNSYLKIKSGWFSTKVQMDSILGSNEEAQVVAEKVEEKQTEHRLLNHTRDRISELYEELFFNEDSKLDILRKSNRYEFSQDDYTYMDNEPVYIVTFTPKGKKDFKGTLYVNTNDFAVVRIEFENVRPLFKFKLLGITYRDNVYRGKMLFEKNESGVYNPKYVSLEQGSYFGVDRPLKIVEKNKFVKGRRKQNELSFGIDVAGTELTKYELVVFNSALISDADYSGTKENKNAEATYLSKYDPNFWKGYTIMEPNMAIQAFEVVE